MDEDSYIKCKKQLKNKKATINPKNKTNVLNIRQLLRYIVIKILIILKDLIRFGLLKNYLIRTKGIKFPARQKDWEKFEKKRSGCCFN